MVAVQAALCALVLGASSETVLLDFSATWCGPCREMDRVVAPLIAQGAPIRKVDIDQQGELARQYRVDGVPCFVMLVEGREVDRQVGATSADRLRQMLNHAQPATAPTPGLLNRGLFGGFNRGLPALPALVAPKAPKTFGDEPSSTTTAAPSKPLLPKSISEPFSKFADGVRNVVGGERPTPPHLAQQVIDRVMRSAVRLRIGEGSGNSIGTGTIIDARAGEALIVTCGHIFRESNGQGRIDVDLLGVQGEPQVTGQLIGFDLKADLALISIRPGLDVSASPLAPIGYQVRPGDAVVSVGCNHGAEATSRVGRVLSTDKFVGPLLQVTGQPVQGRSGGGLFTAEGLVIGVCNAADPQDDAGLYASLRMIHTEVANHGIDKVLAKPAELDTALSATPPTMPSRMPAPIDFTRAAAQSPDNQPVSHTAPPGKQVTLTAHEAALLERVRQQGQHAELICIVRSRESGQAPQRVLVLDQASPELLQHLNLVGRQPEFALSGSAQPAGPPGSTSQTAPPGLPPNAQPNWSMMPVR